MKQLFRIFCLSLLVMVTGMVSAQTYTVAGSTDIVNGTSEWAQGNTENDMTSVGNDYYKLVVQDCSLVGGRNYEYKVVKDHSWDQSWPASNAILNVTESGTYTIIFSFNSNTKAVSAFAAVSVSVVGSATGSDNGGESDILFGTSWDPTSNDMTLQSDGTYKWSKNNVQLSQGAMTYKIVANHAWNQGNWPSSNATLNIPADGIYNCVFTFNPVTKEVNATATRCVAKVGDAYYEKLQSAVEDVPADGTVTTITMIDNEVVAAEGKMTIAAGKNIILDLNGKTVSGSNNNAGNFYFITNSGTLQITDNSQEGEGKITFQSAKTDYNNERVTIYNLGGTLTLTKGTVENTTSGGLAYAINNSSNAWGSDVVSTFNLNGGKVSAPRGDAALRVYQNCAANTTQSKNYVNITGGTIDATGIFVDQNLHNQNIPTNYSGNNIDTEINISGGTVIGLIDMKIRHPFNTLLNITGGDFSNAKMWVRKVANEYVNTCGEPTAPMVTISGGKFEFAGDNTFGLAYDYASTTWTNYEKPYVISGGYFSKEVVQDFIVEGKVCVPATDMEGYFTIGDPHYVAQIGDTKYVSLEAAVNAVPADGTETTIVMIDNETIIGNAGVTIPVGKNVVLDLNGKTVKGVVENPANAQTILNKGTLTITDNSDEKNGTITNEVSDENAGSPGNNKNWFSNAITNTGVLTVNEGNIDNTGTGGACYAIDNQTNGNLQTPVLNIAGGNITAKKVAVRMFCNSTTNVNTVNVTGGKITSENAYALQAQQANKNANKAALNISGGTLTGQYAFADHGDKNTATQFDNATYNITGGFFSGYMWSYATYYCGMEGFVSGGYFDDVIGGDIVAPGKACVDNTEEETKEAYPYTIGLADIHYYWLDNNGNIDGGGYYTIYAPFAGPDPVLMDGEFIELQKDITLTKDIEYIEEVSFGDPIFKGGTFTLKFGEYSIDLNGHAFPIPTGVTILTDKQTDIFSALEEGYKVVEETTETGYAYSVVPKEYVAQNVNSGKKYEKLQTALDEAQEGNEIKILADITQGTVNSYITPNGRITKGITIDGDGHTLTNTSTYVFEITGSGEVTINNTTMVSQTSRGLLVGHENPAFTGTLNINNCAITSNRMGIQIVDPGITVNLNNTIVQSDVDDPISNYTSGNQNGREFTGIDLSDKNITVNLTDCEIRGFRNCFGCETYTSPGNNVVNMTGGKTYGLYVFSHTISLNTNAQHLTYNFEDVDIQSQYLLEEFGRLITVNKVYLTGSTTLPASGKVIDDEGKLCEGMIMMDETVAALYDGKFDNYKVVETTEEPGYTIALKGGNLLVFHDSGNYEQAFVVPMYTRIPGANIYYKVNSGSKTQYTEPLTISADTQLEVWIQVGDTKIGEPITRNYAIVERPAGPSVEDGYYYIKNEGNSKYVNVAGRKTVTFKTLADAKKAAGTVIRVAANGGAVETLRSQAVDLPGYAKRAMNYVPEMVQLVVEKLHADGSGSILGENGLDAIMAKFNESFDYNLYLEEAGGGYRIYGRTPSMKPVVDFYAENKDQVDAKLPQLEEFINNAIDKLKNKLGNSANSLPEFSLETVWQEMGGTLTKPVDDESTAQFYEEVLSSEANVWSFAYETAMMYYEPLINKFDELSSSAEYQELFNQIGDYSKYLEKLPQVRPDFKYYIVADGSKVDFISEGNPNIDENSAIWTLEERPGFNVEFDAANKLVDGAGTKYYTTLYTDFAYTMPEDGNTKAYAVTGVIDVNDKGYAKLAEINGVIPGQTPVLLMTQNESLKATLTLSIEDGTTPEMNLLKGADWVIDNAVDENGNVVGLNTPQLQDLFNIIKDKLGEDFYNNYLAQYEHLLKKNAGTVNNKYFFGLSKDELIQIDEDLLLRQLGVNEEGKQLGFWESYVNLNTNKAFIVDENKNIDPVLLPLWPDVNRDGQVDVNDIIAVVDISLYNDAEERFPYYDFDVADVNGDGAINISDVIAITDIVLSIH